MIKDMHYRCSVCDEPCNIFMSYNDKIITEDDVAAPTQCVVYGGAGESKWIRISKVTKVIKKKKSKRVSTEPFNIGSML